MARQLEACISLPRGNNQWSELRYWMSPPQPRALRSAGQERKKSKLEQESGCGGQMYCAQTMAQWEVKLCSNTEINGGPAQGLELVHVR